MFREASEGSIRREARRHVFSTLPVAVSKSKHGCLGSPSFSHVARACRISSCYLASWTVDS